MVNFKLASWLQLLSVFLSAVWLLVAAARIMAFTRSWSIPAAFAASEARSSDALDLISAFRVDLHRSLQVETLSQQRSHAFRHVNGR